MSTPGETNAEPASRPMYGLIVKQGRNKGSIIPLREEVMTLGRSPTNSVVIDDRLTSKTHAEIARVDDRYLLKDLASKNGTYLNGRKVQEGVLEEDDEIKVGSTHFRFTDITQTDLSPGEDRAPGSDTVAGDLPGRLETLKTLVREVATADDPIDILKVAVRRFITMTEAERGSICLLEEGSLKPFVTIDHEADPSQQPDFDPEEELTICLPLRDRALKERAPRTVEEASDDPELRKDAAVARIGIQAALAVPILLGDRLMGAVYLDRIRDPRPFHQVELDLVEIACQQLALYLEHALYA